jgi:hypothetical protein
VSDQDGTQATTKRHGSHQKSNLNGGTLQVPHRPATEDRKAWKAYWKSQGQPWRTEPEIDEERQKYLEQRRSITPYTIPKLFPFKDIKLYRADVEWLLATHEDGQGPINWKDEK